MKHNESKLQQECVLWFRAQFPHYKKLLFAIPNGGKRNIVTASILKAEGALAGVADLMLAMPRGEYHGLFIEMKHGKNDLSESQEDFKRAVMKHGYRHITCRTFNEFMAGVLGYFNREDLVKALNFAGCHG